MQAACEAGEVLALLEGGASDARAAADALAALYSPVREPWLTRALLLYHARTGSSRILEVLARAPDPHAKHLLDALHEQLRADPPARRHALAALAPLIAKRPPWLHRLHRHPLARELLRAAKMEREPLPLLHALLALAALLPAAPALATPHWPELTDALLRPAALIPPPAPAARAHLQLAQLALFRALYATHPCTLVETLRAEYNTGNNATARDQWKRGVAPLLDSVRLHPALITGSRQREADAARWTHVEVHDVVAECRRLSPRGRTPPVEASPVPTPAPQPALDPAPGSGAHASLAAADLRPGTEPWFSLAERCIDDARRESAPPTPLPADAIVEPVELEPEAAVEATPENTPARETRAQFRFPTESTAVRAIGRRSQPPSPLRKETSPPVGLTGEGYAARLARVAQERRAVESPVPFGGAAPPAGVPRPEPNRPLEMDALNVEDREVLELTARAPAEDPWIENETSIPVPPDPRSRVSRPATRSGRPPLRASSCVPRGESRVSVAVQTVDTWPEPYEFIIADFNRSVPDDVVRDRPASERGIESSLPCQRLDAYLSELYSGRSPVAGNELAEQLALAHAQLMYERWRREAHAERNRRLLGRCRQARALELQNAALKERVRVLTRERDELRVRRPSAPTPAPPDLIPAALEAALEDERMARLKAEAVLAESEAARALDNAELQKIRGESFEAARHVEALARAALAAERRAEHVRRLRRELLILAEREAKIQAPSVPSQAEEKAMAADRRALKAAALKAEAEAEMAQAKAEAAIARAHDLEAALTAKENCVVELKRSARMSAEEQAAKLKSLTDMCDSLEQLVRASEARHLELLAAAPLPPASRRSKPVDLEDDGIWDGLDGDSMINQ